MIVKYYALAEKAFDAYFSGAGEISKSAAAVARLLA